MGVVGISKRVDLSGCFQGVVNKLVVGMEFETGIKPMSSSNAILATLSAIICHEEGNSLEAGNASVWDDEACHEIYGAKLERVEFGHAAVEDGAKQWVTRVKTEMVPTVEDTINLKIWSSAY